MQEITYCYKRLLYAVNNQDDSNKKHIYVFYSKIDGLPFYICGNMNSAGKLFNKTSQSLRSSLLRTKKGIVGNSNYEIHKIKM